jgi:hypothetical protein
LFKNVLLRSLAGATAVGSALAVSLVAGPAATTASPEIRNVACAYPASVSTTTKVALERPVAIYGVSTSATATVSTDAGAGAPMGRVRFYLKNSDGSLRNTWTESLSGGQATITLPRRLPSNRTYVVRARFLPEHCSTFKRSLSDAAYYIVRKPGTRTIVHAPSVHRGERPHVRVAVRSASPLNANGRVRIVVQRRSNVVASRVIRLRHGRVHTSFRPLRPGRYDVKVRYFGARNFRGSRGEDVFRVWRR